MAEYKLTKSATSDLDQILEYTLQKFGSEQAEKYVAQLKNHLAMLSQYPSITAERDEFSPPVRIFPSGGHFIVYIIKIDHISVVRFLHKGMDLMRYL